VLLAGPDGRAWVDAATDLAAASGVPLSASVVGPEGPVVDREGRFGSAFGTGSEGATLLRPDGVVSWRTGQAAEDPRAVLDDVVRRVLCR
jgi:hypothetical protein